MLTAHIPYLEVYWWIRRWKRDGGHVLSDGGHGFQIRVRGCVCALYLFKESGLAGIVKAEEEDRIL